MKSTQLRRGTIPVESTSTQRAPPESSTRVIPWETSGGDITTPDVAVVFERIVTRFRIGWPELFHQDEGSRRIRELVAHQRVSSDIDYERDAWSFTRAFFFKNLYKALVVLSRLQPELRSNMPVLDVGAGAGVATIAWASLYGVPVGGFTLVDLSAAQLDIARRLISLLEIPETRYVIGSYPDILNAAGMQRVFSYWFCEQSADAIANFGAWGFTSNKAVGSVVIDYPDLVAAMTRNAVTAGCYVTTVHERVTPALAYRDLFNDSHFTAAAAYARCVDNT
ncbi:MAG TPA: class I SAM-dependent methyltransferase [Archangium sp.]|nr:class I SAM-dependent methyltransferase [Archangium sp.]